MGQGQEALPFSSYKGRAGQNLFPHLLIRSLYIRIEFCSYVRCVSVKHGPPGLPILQCFQRMTVQSLHSLPMRQWACSTSIILTNFSKSFVHLSFPISSNGSSNSSRETCHYQSKMSVMDYQKERRERVELKQFTEFRVDKLFCIVLRCFTTSFKN